MDLYEMLGVTRTQALTGAAAGLMLAVVLALFALRRRDKTQRVQVNLSGRD